ncbi:MAG TPA: DUF2585 family protein [Thermoanaerobaculia bacterium]
MKIRISTGASWAIGGAIMALAASVELINSRKIWGISGQPGVWAGDVNSSHNSQYLTDPYTFSHITHGMLFYALTWLVARNLPVRVRALIALGAEAVWEIVENTDAIIQRYRAATISLHYYGDSVMNSMCDILACMMGFGLAYLLPRRVSIITVVVLEMALALWIRDGLILNIVMLIHPIPAIRSWQSGG